MNYREQDHALTESSLTQALFELMKDKPFSEITITELVGRAGVSRATYYRNYSCKEEVLTNYIRRILHNFWTSHPLASAREHLSGEYQQEITALVKNYAPLLTILYQSGLAYLYLDCINRELTARYQEELSNEKERIFLYAYAGALFNVIFNSYISELEPDENILSRISEIFYQDYDKFLAAG